MNSIPKEMILHLLNSCFRSEIDLSLFCEEFVFHYLNLPDDRFKQICNSLFIKASDFMMKEPSKSITPEEIVFASDVFESIKQTREKLLQYQNQS